MGTTNKRQQVSLAPVNRVGGGKRDRTADLLHAMQALSQLSYTPNQRRRIISADQGGVKKTGPPRARRSAADARARAPSPTAQASDIATESALCRTRPRASASRA